MKIGLASPRIATSLEEGLATVERLLADAAAQGAAIVCFPEAYLPGLRGQDFEILPFELPQQEQVLQAVAAWARSYAVAVRPRISGRVTIAARQRRSSMTPDEFFAGKPWPGEDAPFTVRHFTDQEIYRR